MENNNLKINKITKTLYGICSSITDLTTAGSFMSGVYLIDVGLKGVPVLGDSVAFNFVMSAAAFGLSVLSASVNSDINDHVNGTEIEEEDLKEERVKGK